MTWVSEVTADSPSWWARLAETSGTSAADVEGGSAGTYVGGFTLAQGSLLNAAAGDKSVALNGSTGYVRFPSQTSLNRGDVFTLECWVMPTAFRDNAGLGGTMIDKGSGAYILRWADALDGRFILRRNSVATIVTSTTAAPLNKPSHIVATKNGSTVKLYLNGVDVTGTVTNSTMVNSSIALGVGAADAGTDNFFAGTIDETVIYSTALSATRVLAHYNAGIQVFGTATNTVGAGTGSATGTKGAKGTATNSAGAGTLSATGKKAGRGTAAASCACTATATGKKGARGTAQATGGAQALAFGIRDAHVDPPTFALIVPAPATAAVQQHATVAGIVDVVTVAAINPAAVTATIQARSTVMEIPTRSTSAVILGRQTSASIHA